MTWTVTRRQSDHTATRGGISPAGVRHFLLPSQKAIIMNANDIHFTGIRFPTLAHAQWALFFEDLFIPWQFRSRSLILGSGLEYEPDFWLPRQTLWVQVEGSVGTEDFRLWHEFATAVTADAAGSAE